MALKPATPFVQDPTARLDYAIDWTKYLESGDQIATATARVDPTATGIAVEEPVELVDNTSTVVWVTTTGAAAGKYTIVIHVVTAAAREDERSIIITVADQ